MLDINLFRVEKGGNPDLVRESQRRRGKDPKTVDEIIELDKEWVAGTPQSPPMKKGSRAGSALQR